MSPEARVGLVTLLAFLLAIATVIFLRGGVLLHRQEYELTIRFSDAAGLTVGAPVRMAGVTVGRVKALALASDNQAQVTIAVTSALRIPQGSHFLVATAGFLGDRFISIAPGAATASAIPAGEEVQGEEPFTLEGLATRFQQVTARVEQLVDNLNSLVADPELHENLRQALRNANETAAIARQTATNVERTTRQVQRLLNTDVAAVVADLRQMSHLMAETATRLQAFVETTTGDGALARDLRETAASAREASDRIARMAADLQGVINPENISKAREMVTDARETLREARTVVQRADSVMQRVDRLVPSDLRFPSLRTFVRLDYEVWYAGQRAGHGLDLSLLPDADRFYRLGLHDIGATNGLVLQAGQRFGPTLAGRAGIFESQVGVGLDYRLLDPFILSLDLYNVNQLTLDAVGRYQIAPNWRITLGGKSLLRQPIVIFGIGANY